ncbi:hypothetical protein [Cypionkella aquatica]|uniref:hypothetical protein n=1 Tax=Cypionkella aquatica TaxID=1756042 RepID=UPI003D669142
MIDVFAWRIVSWRASTSMNTQFVLDALEQVIWQGKTRIVRAWSTNLTADHNTCRSSIPISWSRQKSTFSSARLLTPMIMLGPNASSVSSKLRHQPDPALGN